MSNGSSGGMVIAGQAGGKSTFLGAMASHITEIREEKWQGDYNVKYGEESEFEEMILDTLLTHKEFPPEQTFRVDSYLVELTIHSGSSVTPQRNLTIMDIPGEVQEEAIEENPIEKLLDDEVNREEIIEQYNKGLKGSQPVREKIEEGQRLERDENEQRCAYLYQYINSDKIIFLLNIHKFLNRDINPILTPDLIRSVSAQKECLLLVTAADLIDYNPSQFRSGLGNKILSQLLSISPHFFDHKFYEYLRDGNRLRPGSDATNIKRLTKAAKNSDMGMFTIAVPEGSHGIQTENGHIKTLGYDNVVEWLVET